MKYWSSLLWVMSWSPSEWVAGLTSLKQRHSNQTREVNLLNFCCYYREVNKGGQWNWAVNEAWLWMMPVSEKPWMPGSIDTSKSLTAQFDWLFIYNEVEQSKFFTDWLHWLPSFIDDPAWPPALINLSIILLLLLIQLFLKLNISKVNSRNININNNININ